jgi:hypothetical protein
MFARVATGLRSGATGHRFEEGQLKPLTMLLCVVQLGHPDAR